MNNSIDENGLEITNRSTLSDLDNADKKPKKNKSQVLIALAEKQCELWNSEDSIAYATWRVGEHFENWRIHSKQFSRWLNTLFYNATGNVCGKEALSNAIEIFECKALEGQYHKTYLRVANNGNGIYIDIGDSDWNCVEVSAGGWKVINDPPVKFVRTKNTGLLPMPEKGGDIDLLKPLATSVDQNWTFMKGFLLDAFKGFATYCVLSVSGCQGSAKSSACKLLKDIIDPNKVASLSNPSHDEKELGVLANSEFCLAFNNVSYIQQWYSDSLCRISDGGGFKSRTLYTDFEQCIFDVSRPIILNGIPQCVESNDLLDRTLLIEQIQIPDNMRREERELNAEYDRIKGMVFGGILDLLSQGLRNLPTTIIPALPRRADSVRWSTACLVMTNS